MPQPGQPPQEGEVRQNRLDPNRKAIFTNGHWYEVGVPGKPMSGAAMTQDGEDSGAINAGSGVNASLHKYQSQLEGGDLKLGVIENLASGVKNWTGLSDPSSRNFSSFRSALEKMRNDSLRLNKGVQTEGDAQRAWNELVTNLHDTELVKQRLREIEQINAQAIQYRKRSLVSRRATQGAMMVDPSQFEVPQNAFAPAAPKRAAPQGKVKASGTGAEHLTDAQIKAMFGFQ